MGTEFITPGLVLMIGLGGFIGTSTRYLSQVIIYRFFPASFPIGTLSVNLIGCLLIGIFFALSEKGNLISAEWKLFLTIGFCGGFTTFSAFSLECVQLIHNGEYLYLILYTLGSVVIGMLATILGIWTTNTILSA